MPMQLVFGRDTVLNTKFEANWTYIKVHKQELINKNNELKNKKQVQYQYHIGDKVLYKTAEMSKFGKNAWKGPYEITSVRHNGTVCLHKDKVTDTINIRNIKPYHE